MKTLIAYATTHGCTERCAGLLRDMLTGTVDLINLKKKDVIDFELYDTVILGGSIHAGTMKKSVKNFVKTHEQTLLKKKIGLFVCCMYEGEQAETQFKDAFPEPLRAHAAAKGIFGGEFDFSKMNFVEKFLVKKIAGVASDVTRIETEAIKKFANCIKQ